MRSQCIDDYQVRRDTHCAFCLHNNRKWCCVCGMLLWIIKGDKSNE